MIVRHYYINFTQSLLTFRPTLFIYDLFKDAIYLILPAALGPGVYSASNRNEYQKHYNNNVSGE
jgi:hypothetical protein